MTGIQNISVEDLTGDVTELTGEELDMVVGGMRPGSGYVCTATQAGSSEDCWND